MRNRKWTGLILAMVLLLVTVLPCYGKTTKEKLSNAEAEKATTESQLDSIQSRINDLNSKRGQTEAYLTELAGQIDELTTRLQELQQQYDEKQEELVWVQQELEEAKAEEEEQYQAMKLRIRYIYENSRGNGYVEMLFSSDNLADFINRAEYIQRISDYDRDLMDEYQETVERVKAKETQVIEEQMAIADLQKESNEQQEAIQELYAGTYQDLRACLEELDSAKADESSLAAKISSQEEAINALIRQAKEEEIAAQKKAEEEAAAKAAAEEAARREQEKKANQQSTSSDSSSGPKKDTSGSSASGSSVSSKPSEESSSSSDGSTGGTYLGKFRLTGYCSCSKCCGQWAGGSTASGTTPTPGRTIAMGGVPFGTKLLINGQIYTVEDRGTAYGHVDVFFGSHSDALQFGTQYADVYMVE